jgi:hypothetical protein
MTKIWNTKYGARQVKYDPPTLDQALFAAAGLSDDADQQAEIAASLMGMPVAEVRAQITTSAPKPSITVRLGTIARSTGPVIVERRPARRIIPAAARRLSSGA